MKRTLRIGIGIGIGALAIVSVAGVLAAKAKDGRRVIDIDPENNPNLYFRIDNFSVPDTAREEFEQAMHRNMAFIEKLPGFRGHVVFEKAGGPTSFNVATIAVWEDKEAFDKASVAVRTYYKEIGFDTAAAMAKWGVRAEIGAFVARRDAR